MFFLLVSYHLIGVAQWCMVDKEAQTIQCNYESKIECEGYAYNNEVCIPNPNL